MPSASNATLQENAEANGSTNQSLSRSWLVALAVCTLGASWFGWRSFWFLTDDAFITFRYVSNAVMGRGLVWNPAPFAAVEGYTSFLWTVLLAAVWKVTGLTPPDVANALSFGFGLITLAMIAAMALRMRLPDRAQRFRYALLSLILLGTVTNRTFLTWLSSGLETALHNMLLTAWLWACLAREERASWISSTAALMALTRPDGLLFVAATPVVIGLGAWGSGRRFPLRALAPLLVVAVHLLWRVQRYGEWVPNTYFAKHVAAWPEAGVRYAASFSLEYGLWFWALIVGAWFAASVRQGRFERSLHAIKAHARFSAVFATLLAHVGYYTFIIGGDHFEYRVYSQLVPLFFLSAAWFAAWAFKRGAAILAALVLFILFSWPIPWAHYALSKDLTDRASTRFMRIAVAEHVPFFMQPLGLVWDELQDWLIAKRICTRHQEHQQFWLDRMRRTPSREIGQRIAWADRPVMAAESVGIFAWSLPNVAIIDKYGLNDRVVAHAPVDPEQERSMAHERHPPSGYVVCFRPNVFWTDQGIRVARRASPLSDQEIVACEQRFFREVGISD
jgi:arabinofuranosyltransferase